MRRSLLIALAMSMLVVGVVGIADASDHLVLGRAFGTDVASAGPRDATVIAIIDTGLNPYHWDFLAAKMPQHEDATARNDLPLDAAPHTWLPNFPDPAKEFASYDALDLTLDPENPDRTLAELRATDQKVWDGVQQSAPDEMHYYWMPGTKVIGAMTFATRKIIGSPNSHGVGTTSSAVGNIHGTCPECLLFFIELGSREDSEKAISWAMKQPWIDAISNSYGFSLALRDRIYSGSDIEMQRRASERGQTVFFSAGNGQEGAFVVPNTTVFSSQEGPDWIITVGATTPGEDNYYYRDSSSGLLEPVDKTATHASFMGHGKPADVAGIGSNYPTAYYSDSVGGTGQFGFGGTSNATPQVTGAYARALYLARQALAGPSSVQAGGVIARGRPVACGSKRKDCELGDGRLTAVELRTRLLHGAIHTEAGMSGPAGAGQLPAIGEEEFLNEGHGSYFGLETGRRTDYLAEFARIFDPMIGAAPVLERPAGERDWMVVDSFCRQHVWGAWSHGYYIDGKTALPGVDRAWPLRSAIETTCPHLIPPP
ncbi:MAG: S8 family peptidase, partial [Actinomycetota bacterium]|nr:S8 family peptidase [Actinomycetota bacterium]